MSLTIDAVARRVELSVQQQAGATFQTHGDTNTRGYKVQDEKSRSYPLTWTQISKDNRYQCSFTDWPGVFSPAWESYLDALHAGKQTADIETANHSNESAFSCFSLFVPGEHFPSTQPLVSLQFSQTNRTMQVFRTSDVQCNPLLKHESSAVQQLRRSLQIWRHALHQRALSPVQPPTRSRQKLPETDSITRLLPSQHGILLCPLPG